MSGILGTQKDNSSSKDNSKEILVTQAVSRWSSKNVTMIVGTGISTHLSTKNKLPIVRTEDKKQLT